MFKTKSSTALYILICVSLLLTLTLSQSVNFNAIITTPSSSALMINDGQIQPLFTFSQSLYNCSLPPLFNYTQNAFNYKNNTAYTVTVTNPPLPITQPTITTIHNNFVPTLSVINLTPTGYTIVISNNCPTQISFFNYFDRLQLTIAGGSNSITLSYYIICNQQHLASTFQWGLLIQIVFCTILIFLVAIYSRAWSIGGIGITIKIWMVIVLNVLMVGGGVVGYLSDQAMQVVLNITCFVLGTIGVAICCNQLLFLMRNNILRINLFSLKSFQFRVMELISLVVGLGLTLGWFFSGKNMIVNDIICCCMIVGFIKILKFTSLQTAGICFLITMAVQMTFVIVIHFKTSTTYNLLFLNKYNFPVELQMPTINPVYNQKCAWLPFTTIIYPGMLLSYFRRFDSSRSTNVYLIYSSIVFFVGAIAWMFISIANPFAFPLGLISQPCMFGLVCIFAYRRRQIRVLWEGKFYDEQFADQQDLKHTIELISKERRQSGMTVDDKLIEELKNGSRDSRTGSLLDQDVVHSKFYRT